MATKPRSKGGRPHNLTPKLQEEIFAKLRTGTPVDLTADSVGVPRGTFREWVRRGEGLSDRPAIEPFVSFATGYRQSRAKGEEYLRSVILQAASGKRPVRAETGEMITESFSPNAESLRAAMWLLARGWPQYWGGHRESVAVDVDVAQADDESGGGNEGNGGVHINVILASDAPSDE